MACRGCLKTFGLFNSEQGCPICKYSFCSKCLRNRAVHNGKKCNVCLRCSELQNIQSSGGNTSEGSSTTAFGSSLDAKVVLCPPLAPVQIHLPASAKSSNYDCSDLEKRLAALKDTEWKDYKTGRSATVAPKSGETQVQDLLGQLDSERVIDDKVNQDRAAIDEEIRKRLDKLKELPVETSGGSGVNKTPESIDICYDSDNEDEATAKLVARYLEECTMDSKLPAGQFAVNQEEAELDVVASPADDEVLPWCNICNEDAVVSCLGCDNELYCKACFAEFHYDEDPKEHRTKPFKPKGGNSGLAP